MSICFFSFLEWYIVQVTAQFEDSVYLQYNKNTCHSMHALHITILPTGNSILKPLCITLPKPQTYTMYDICNEIREILGNNKSDLTATYANKELYWKMRLKQDNKMKVFAVSKIAYYILDIVIICGNSQILNILVYLRQQFMN